MNKFLFSADWHLRPTHYGSAARGLDFFTAAKDVVSRAVNLNIPILNGGDMLDSSAPPSSCVQQVEEIHNTLVAARLPMFHVDGNHDFSSPSWTRLFDKSTSDNTENLCGIVDAMNRIFDWRGTIIAGLPPVSSLELPTALEKLPDNVDIVLWHGAIQEFIGYPSPSTLSMEQLKEVVTRKNIGAILMGDIHVRQYYSIQEPDSKRACVIGYPGSTELVKRDEPLNKTVDIIHALPDHGQVTPGEPIAINHRPVIAHHIEDAADLTALEARIRNWTEEHPCDERGPLITVGAASPEMKRAAEDLIYTRFDASKMHVRVAQGPKKIADVSMWQAVQFQAAETRGRLLKPEAVMTSAFPAELQREAQLAQNLLMMDGRASYKKAIDEYVADLLK